MGQESYSHRCECGNQISVDTYHHAGGINDKDMVKLKCNKCGNIEERVIKNVESASISGASLV